MSNIKLFKGDCLELMKNIPDRSIDAIITDPPYGTTACKWDSVIPFDLMWEQLNRIIKPNGAIVLFGSEPFSSALRMSNIKNYKYDWFWVKGQPSGFLNAKKQPLRNVENISVFYIKQPIYKPQLIDKRKDQIRFNNIKSKQGKTEILGKIGYLDNRFERREIPLDKTYPFQTLNYSLPSANKGRFHPTQKPVALIEYLIKTYTNENETVLDFTMGSGTTGVACKNLNRKFIGIEMDDKYFEIAKNRIENHQPQQKLF
jgi:site-specific DNA-methyltransferase (adenine-specific)